MRFIASLAVFAFVLGFGAGVQAQDISNGQGYVYTPRNSGNDDSEPAIYNNTVTPYVAGRNAPSYDFTATKPQVYNEGVVGSYSGSMSPAQAQAYRAQRDAQAAAYQQDYLAQFQEQAGQAGIALPQGVTSLGQEPEDAKKPKKRKVVYNEKNDPLVAPPRLFNPDQR